MATLDGSYQKCTVIETLNGEVKLIKRSDDAPADLETLSFANLEDCMEYVGKNKFQISVTHIRRNRKETIAEGKQ